MIEWKRCDDTASMHMPTTTKSKQINCVDMLSCPVSMLLFPFRMLFHWTGRPDWLITAAAAPRLKQPNALRNGVNGAHERQMYHLSRILFIRFTSFLVSTSENLHSHPAWAGRYLLFAFFAHKSNSCTLRQYVLCWRDERMNEKFNCTLAWNGSPWDRWNLLR